MKTHKLLLVSSVLFFLLTQGCDSEVRQQNSSPTAIGKSTSITTDIPDSKMAPSKHTVDAIAKAIGSIINLHISELNEKEAISLTKETNYCDISGLKNIEYSKIKNDLITLANYDSCKSEENLQHGNIQTIYKNLNNEQKFPKTVTIESINQYLVNHLSLEKSTKIEGNNLQYKKDNSLKSIELTINGDVTYYRQKIQLTNYKTTITF